MTRRRAAAAASAVALCLALAAAASARADGAAPSLINGDLCFAAGYTCTSVPVPLDRTGAVPGTVGLGVLRHQVGAAPSRSAVVPLAGGPGQASIPIVSSWLADLEPFLETRDLLLFDQRGTGNSMPLVCDALNSSRLSLEHMSRSCANGLGRLRGSFRTADSVEDLEALRRWGGWDKLVLHGVSYGTRLALDYASAHPQHVEALILDSVTPQSGEDPFARPEIQALPGALRDLCRGGCASFTRDPVADVRATVRHIRAGRDLATVHASDGTPRAARLTEAGVLNALSAGDLDPGLRGAAPGLLAAAARGDLQPLLRLQAALDAPPGAASTPFDLALFLATTCEEQPMPWARGTLAASARRAATAAAARAVPAAQVAPFGAAEAVKTGYAPYCLGWPALSAPQPAPGPLPQVPTLVLEGAGDLRTPVAQARAAVASIPGAQLVTVPRLGHSVLSTDDTGCAAKAVARFAEGLPVEPCTKPSRLVTIAPPPPRSFADLERAEGYPGAVGRTLSAVVLTLRDAVTYAGSGMGGLRGGAIAFDDRVGALRLTRDSYVRGVWVSGAVSLGGKTTRLTVGGAQAARGTLRLDRSGDLAGRLGGREVSSTLATAVTARAAAAAAAGWRRRSSRSPSPPACCS